VNSTDESQRKNLFDHPEMKSVFRAVLPLVSESDRGAVLIGAAIVDEQLRKLFEAIAPPGVGGKSLKGVLEYPGSLSSTSAKAEIAYLTRYISADMKRAIDVLRRMRNDVAHSPEFFQLRDHEQRLRKMFELGPGVPAAVNRMGIEMLTATAVRNLLDIEKPFGETPEPLFKSPREVVEYLADSPDLIEKNMEPHRLRWELGMGVAFLCALIVYYREEAVRLLGSGLIIGRKSDRESDADEGA
jgi:hypothetical protein